MNKFDTLIEVADDCPTKKAQVPPQSRRCLRRRAYRHACHRFSRRPVLLGSVGRSRGPPLGLYNRLGPDLGLTTADARPSLTTGAAALRPAVGSVWTDLGPPMLASDAER